MWDITQTRVCWALRTRLTPIPAYMAPWLNIDWSPWHRWENDLFVYIFFQYSACPTFGCVPVATGAGKPYANGAYTRLRLVIHLFLPTTIMFCSIKVGVYCWHCLWPTERISVIGYGHLLCNRRTSTLTHKYMQTTHTGPRTTYTHGRHATMAC